jgi:uncharacterized protein (DUF488 family)
MRPLRGWRETVFGCVASRRIRMGGCDIVSEDRLYQQYFSTPVATIYTIGHSTRTLDELIAALKVYDIRTLVDIRSFPMSRRMPHFNRESLEAELPRHGIAYAWMKKLGGRRKKIRNDSPHTGLRNDSFRNYADYMQTDEFAQAVERLLGIVQGKTDPSTAFDCRGELAAVGMTTVKGNGGTAIMCAERVYFQCHRMLVSDYLTAHGHTVLHIDDDKHPLREHQLMAEARLADGKLVYDAQQLF